jgi:hypothetical protein
VHSVPGSSTTHLRRCFRLRSSGSSPTSTS